MTCNVFGGTLNLTQPSTSPAQPAASVYNVPSHTVTPFMVIEDQMMVFRLI